MPVSPKLSLAKLAESLFGMTKRNLLGKRLFFGTEIGRSVVIHLLEFY
jgi:hypothetical protein